MVQTVLDFLNQYVSPEIAVFIVSMLPVLELRGGLIASALMEIPWTQATAICLAGTVLPVPVLLLFVRRVLDWLKKTRVFYRIAHGFETKALTKGGQLLEKYPGRIQFALFLFVAIPLPGTGAWTGSLVAAFLNLPVRRSFPMIALGSLAAAIIMLALTYLLPSVFSLV